MLRRLWDKLTAVHPSITDIEMRRQSHLLAAFILVLVVPFSMMVIRGLVNAREMKDFASTLILLSNIGILLFEYYLNRTGRYRASAYLFILLAFFFIHILSLTSVVGEPSRMFYLGAILLVSSILLSLRMSLILFFVSVVLQLLFAFLAPQTATIGNPSPFFFTLVIGPLILVFWQHRAELERERQTELQAANAALRESEASLERRVAARTRDLTIAAQVSQQVNRVLELDQLLPQLTELTRTGFDLYQVSVFLYDEDSGTLHLKAGTGEVGRQMVSAGKQFRLEGRGLVPLAASGRLAQVSDDVSQSPDHFVNPILPNTRAEAALPMIVGDKLIGVLDLQAEEVNRFSGDDLRVFTSLADHIAIAVQNASLYAEQVEIADKLREVDRVKSQFLASMSHELRTPLNAILNFTEFVAVGMLGEVTEKQKDALAKVLDSGRHLLSLINDVLDMTKIEAGMMKLFVEENINVQDELKVVIATAQTLLKDKPVQFVQAIDPHLPAMVGDKRRIRQILLNLVSNACKFTEEGSVTLSAKQQGDEILFGVMDTGPGIAPEDQELIFEPFKQTETGIKHAAGTGLGLPICKRLIEAHNGRIWVESKSGEGAAFFAALPAQSSALLAQLKKENLHA